MSSCPPVTTNTTTQPTPPLPPWMPPIRAGEIDGRYVNCTPDLGAFNDVIPTISAVTLVINRADGRPIDSTDLTPAGVQWPNTVDTTGLIITFGFNAPITNPGRIYNLTFTVNKTAQGRLFVRDLKIQVTPSLG